MVYGGFKVLPRRTASDKALRNKAFDIAKNLKNEKYFHLLKIIFEVPIQQICN